MYSSIYYFLQCEIIYDIRWEENLINNWNKLERIVIREWDRKLIFIQSAVNHDMSMEIIKLPK